MISWQMPPHAAMQPGGVPYMHHPQLAAVQQQIFMSKVAMQFNPQQMQDQQLLQHQHSSVIQAQMGVKPGSSNGVHVLHAEGTAF